MKIKKNSVVFVCQVAKGILKVTKSLTASCANREFTGIEAQAIPADIDEQQLSAQIKQVFDKLGYNNNPIIISLPRHQAACRYLKIPSIIPEEIEKIANLQSWRYLPYPSAELITGYQVIHTDKKGYSYINLIIAHKDVIERYFRIFKEFKAQKIAIVLSSYGLSGLYSYIELEAQLHPVIIVDIDSEHSELAVIFHKKMLFSRSFRFSLLHANWKNLVIDEINKTHNAYLKEVSCEPAGKVIIFNTDRELKGLAETINKQTSLPVEVLSYKDKIKFSNQLLTNVLNSDNSFAGLLGLGLGLEDIPDSLNLLPQDIKNEAKNNSLKKERLKIILLIFGAVLTLALGIARGIDNKTQYLAQLKVELNKIAKEAKPIEEMEKRLKLMSSRGKENSSALNILYELHQIIPGQMRLTNFIYEENSRLSLRGQIPELDSVFTFVSQLEKSRVFKNFDVKVKYATQKKAQASETVDFEIICSKK